jgi:2-phosphosulfolactate phosphatase
VQALSAGARALFPVASIEEALRLANTLGRDEVLLCGERKSLPIEGFDLGNSPGDFTPERVGGKTLVMSTTNGTGAMMAAAAASRVIVGSFLNQQAVVDELVRSGAEPVFLCSGRETKFGLEDAVCAGRMAAAVMAAASEGEWELNDGARAALALAERYPDLEALFAEVGAGRQIVEAGLGDDLAFCARVDLLDVIPVFHDRQISLAAAGVES